MSHYDVNVILYRLKKDAAFRARFQTDAHAALATTELTAEERDAFVRWDAHRLNELGGSLHLLVSIPELGSHEGASSRDRS
jgi:aromatic-ring opening dioxygenase LigAB LigA subunit